MYVQSNVIDAPVDLASHRPGTRVVEGSVYRFTTTTALLADGGVAVNYVVEEKGVDDR